MAGLELKIEGDIDAMVHSLSEIERKVVPAATVSALNKTARQVRTQAIRRIASVKGVQQKVVRPLFRLKGARFGRLYATIRLRRGGFVGYAKLGTPRQLKSGAAAGRRRFPGAFVATMPNGHVGIFKRKPGARTSKGVDSKGRPKRHRLPIQELGIRLSPQAEQITRELVLGFARAKFPQIFEHELQFRLRKRGLL